MRGFIVEPGDIIVSCAGTIGEIFVIPSDSEIGIINQALMRIRLYLKSIQDYFILYFDSVLKKEANDKGKGTAIKNIPPFDILKKMLFPLPPENEIKRLINEVNQLTRITSNISYLILDIKKINLTIKSKVLDLFFGENSSYKSYYPSCAIKDVCKLENGEISNKGLQPYLEAKAIRGTKVPEQRQSGIFIEKGTKVILVDGENSGEIMTAPFNGYMGSTFKIFSANLKMIDEDYLSYFILLKKQELREAKTGSAIPHLNKKLFNQYEIIVPPLYKQKEIVKKITTVFNVLNKIA